MKTKKLIFGTIADPIATFNPKAETTFFLLKEITRRGHESWIMELKDLFLEEGEVYGEAKKVGVFLRRKTFSYHVGSPQKIALKDLNCLFLRKDPPVDMEYINHLTLLEMVKRPLMINAPSGIKKANEKIYPFRFPGISPPSVVSQLPEVLLSFLKKHKKGVVKPLNAGGGKGIFLIHHGDPDARSLLELATDNFTRYVLLQKYIPEAKKGDKRVLLLNGEPLGSFLRIPSRNDFRGNLHSGARFVKSPLTSGEKRVIERLKPALRRDGLLFVGVDFIGPYVTEINTTSPMGIREINHLYHARVEKGLLNFIETCFR